VGYTNALLSKNKTNASGSSQEFCLRDGDTAYSDLYITWETDYGTEGKQYIDVSVNWRTAAKGGGTTANDAFGDFVYTSANCMTQRFAPSAANCRQLSSGRYFWAVPMSSIVTKRVNGENSGTTTSSVFAQVFGSSTSFASRKYDGIDFNIFIDVLHETGTRHSTSTYVHVWYVPKYTLTSMTLTVGGDLAIGYSVSSSWTRANDRFAIAYLRTASGERLVPYNRTVTDTTAANTIWGVVKYKGYMTVPLSSLIRSPEEDETIYVGIRVVGALAPTGIAWGSMSGSATFSSGEQPGSGGVMLAPCESVTASVSVASTSYPALVVSGVKGTGDKTQTANGYVAKLVCYNSNFTPYACDTVTSDGSLSASSTLYFPPLGSTVYVQVFGMYTTGDDSVMSSPKTYGPYTIPKLGRDGLSWNIVQSAEEPLYAMAARYNVERSFDGNRNQDIVQFNGRSRPSVFFDKGATLTHSLSFDIDPMENPNTYALDNYIVDGWDYDLDENVEYYEGMVRELLSSTVCIVRQQNGYRYAAALTSVGSTYSRNPPLLSISVSAQEVDYGD